MKKYFELKCAVQYIEKHLTDTFTQKDIAKCAMVSLSSLQKIFKHSLGYSINEYITKRSISDAAKRLITESASVTDLALDYGYSNVESFSRAFQKVYGVLPSQYKKDSKHGELFTAVDVLEDTISRECGLLVQALQENNSGYVVCFDVVGIKAINSVSRQAGDIALITALKRIHEYTDERFLVFRIGGDEFAVITPFCNTSEAENFMEQILKHNEEAFSYDGMHIPVCVRGWFGKNASVSPFEKAETMLQKTVKYQGKE